MNLVVFSGYIGNIQYRRVNDEFSVCDFSLAWSYKNKDNEQLTHWFTFKAYNKKAEFVNQYFHKGDPIQVTGHLSTESWETQEGEKRTKTIIVVENVEFPIGKKKDGVSGSESGVQSESPASIMAPPSQGGATMAASDGDADDLPF